MSWLHNVDAGLLAGCWASSTSLASSHPTSPAPRRKSLRVVRRVHALDRRLDQVEPRGVGTTDQIGLRGGPEKT